MNNTKYTGAEIFVKKLEKLGVDTLIGIPGVQKLKIYKALLKSKINAITVKNESGAGFMADGYARLSSKTGVALTITGPGLTNILTAMGQAYQDSVPLLVISTQLPSLIKNQNTGTLHELRNSTIMASSVSKESRCIESIDQIETILKEAYTLTQSHRPGPVHVEVPLDILDQVYDCEITDYSYKQNLQFNLDKVEAAIKMINQSKKICLIVGGGAVTASEEITKLSEVLSAPVLSTAAGKGVISDKNPLSLGGRLHYPPVNDFINNQDCVIAIGTQLAPTDLWDSKLNLDGKLIQIDLDSDQFYRYPQADIGLLADAKTLITYILNKLTQKELVRGIEVNQLIKQSKSILEDISGNHTSLPMACEFCELMSSFIEDDTYLYADMTTAAYIGISEIVSTHPRSFMHPAGFGTLGYSLPAAIGAKFVNKQEKIIALIGDGGFQFTMQELAVAVENNLNLPIIIWNNDGYGEIKRNEEYMGFDTFIAVDSKPIDFMQLAEAYNIPASRPTNIKELQKAIDNAFKETKPTIIEVHENDWILS